MFINSLGCGEASASCCWDFVPNEGPTARKESERLRWWVLGSREGKLPTLSYPFTLFTLEKGTPWALSLKPGSTEWWYPYPHGEQCSPSFFHECYPNSGPLLHEAAWGWAPQGSPLTSASTRLPWVRLSYAGPWKGHALVILLAFIIGFLLFFSLPGDAQCREINFLAQRNTTLHLPHAWRMQGNWIDSC